LRLEAAVELQTLKYAAGDPQPKFVLLEGKNRRIGCRPTFCRVALDFYIEFLGDDEQQALEMADEHEVKIDTAPFTEVSNAL
jgi:hypothetical protein